MALKEVYTVIASNLPIDADTFGDTIPAGRIVSLNANGQVELPNALADIPFGITADAKAQAFSATVNNPESANLVMGSWHTTTSGSTRWTQNRVADQYNETLASGLMTVYHGGGEFWTDQYATTTAAGGVPTYAPGDILYFTNSTTNANVAAGLVIHAAAASESTWHVGAVIGEPQALPSGVPGTEVEGSLSFGTFLHMVLNIGM
jgi:hypothetical protein